MTQWPSNARLNLDMALDAGKLIKKSSIIGRFGWERKNERVRNGKVLNNREEGKSNTETKWEDRNWIEMIRNAKCGTCFKKIEQRPAAHVQQQCSGETL